MVTHGYTGWHLYKKALASLEHFDVLTQSNITGGDWDKVAHEREFILTNHIRSRRLQYLERVLEMHHISLPFKMLLALHTHLRAQPPTTRPWDGTIFMDLPNPKSLGAIQDLINDRDKWCRLCSRVGLTNPPLIHSRTTRARSARLKGGGDANQQRDRAKRQRNRLPTIFPALRTPHPPTPTQRYSTEGNPERQIILVGCSISFWVASAKGRMIFPRTRRLWQAKEVAPG